MCRLFYQFPNYALILYLLLLSSLFICIQVERERSKDAAQGVKVAQVLEGYVRRKVVKQTVMTTVYGVTRFGARLQIARQLKGN